MQDALPDISVERLLGQDIPELVGFHKDIVMINNFGDMQLFSHPARLKATTVLICLEGEIDCSINLKRFHIKENHLLVNFAGDIIRIHSCHNISGYAILLSEEYLQQLQLDFRVRTQSYISMRGNGPIAVPYGELAALKPYYDLFKKNMNEGNSEVLKGLVQALSYTVIGLIKQYRDSEPGSGGVSDVTRGAQLFDRFMTLLGAYHSTERSIQFYAGKMCLTPKYVSGQIKAFSGKGALEWISEYVALEAKMMLRYTDMTVQEIAYRLNFPTQSAFGKYFKQQSGVSPGQYRAQQ